MKAGQEEYWAEGSCICNILIPNSKVVYDANQTPRCPWCDYALGGTPETVKDIIDLEIYDLDSHSREFCYSLSELKPVLRRLDIEKVCQTPNHGGVALHWHPDIDTKKTYLIKWGGCFAAGHFSEQWFGYTFSPFWGGSTLQLDKPGWNCSKWEAIWEIEGK